MPGRGRGPALELAAVIALVFLVPHLTLATVGGGWAWDLANATGFLALAGLVFQMIPRDRAGGFRRHERLGYWVLGLASAHALWMLLLDDTLRVYLWPGAPLFMWLGLVGLAVLAVLCVIARLPDRMRVHPRYRGFRRMHRWLSMGALILTGLHVALSGFYLDSTAELTIFAVVITAACLAGRWTGIRDTLSARLIPLWLLGGGIAVALFALIRLPGP